MIKGKASFQGNLGIRVIRKKPESSVLTHFLSKYRKRFSKVWAAWNGGVVISSCLRARHYIAAEDRWIDFGVVSRREVTDAFVEFMVDNLKVETSAWGDFKFHDSGTGTTAADQTDTALETPCGEARDVGTQIEGATAEIYKTVATNTYAGSFAITEHGLFNIAAAGTLMDRHVFAAINVAASDQIEFTYELTCTAGG